MIVINLDKAKAIAHDVRRELRSREFDPLDTLIMKQIPGTDVAAVEAQRQLIRDKYAIMQDSINSAESPDQLKQIIQ